MFECKLCKIRWTCWSDYLSVRKSCQNKTKMEKQGKLEETNHPVCLLYLKQVIQSCQLLYLCTEHSNATLMFFKSHRPSNKLCLSQRNPLSIVMGTAKKSDGLAALFSHLIYFLFLIHVESKMSKTRYKIFFKVKTRTLLHLN